MSLITVVRDVCAVVGVAAPTSVFASIGTNRTMFEMLACANEMAQRIAYDTRDWTALYAAVTYVGDGVALDFDLPADYLRMLVPSHLWLSGSTQQPAEFISDIDEWMQRRATNSTDAWGEWIIYGGQIHIWPALAAGVTARFTYIDKNCIALASGGVGDRFLSDDDTFRLSERLLKLGMIYDWKAKKGSPYAEDMGTFSDALAMEAGRDRPAPIMIFSGRSGGMHAYY